jgi:hypothetical protein
MVAKHLAGLLAPMIGHTAHHVKNSADFIHLIRTFRQKRYNTTAFNSTVHKNITSGIKLGKVIFLAYTM